jgi:hypothetical protein
MGIPATSVATITVLNRPYEFETVDHDNNVLQYVSHFTFKETPEGGTHVHVSHKHHAENNAIGRLAAPLVIRRYRKQFVADLETLKEMLEEGVVIQHP